ARARERGLPAERRAGAGRERHPIPRHGGGTRSRLRAGAGDAIGPLMRPPSPFGILAVLVAAVAAWLLLFALPRWYGRETPQAPASSDAPAQAEAARRINATLFYVSEDGMNLVGVAREVPHAGIPSDQARRIV